MPRAAAVSTAPSDTNAAKTAKTASADTNAVAAAINANAWPYRFEIIKLSQTIVDDYQRPLTTFVKRIQGKPEDPENDSFNPALVGTLCLSERSKTKFAVIDGQTRVEGMKRRGLKEAPALVFSGLTREQEADLFSLLQTERRAISSGERFQARLIAKEPVAVEIAEVLDGLGFHITHNVTGPGAVRAVAAVEYVYHGASGGKKAREGTKDPALLSAVMETIRSAWPKLPETAKSKVMIRGLGYYLKHTEGVNLERLADDLGTVTPTVLAKRAQAVREVRGMSGGDRPSDMADAIKSLYSRSKRGPRPTPADQ